MSLVVNTNIAAMNAQRNLQGTENRLAMSMEELSSGLRINTAANDVAGYSISQELQAQVGGLKQAYQNTHTGVALTQTAQGALNDVANILQKVRALAVEYENGVNSTESKAAITGEVKALVSEVQRVGETTKFNGVALLSGGNNITFQVGANEKEVLGLAAVCLVSAANIGELLTKIEGSAHEGISYVENAINVVSEEAAKFGAVQNRLEYIQANQEVFTQNLASAASAVRDANMAEAMSNFTQQQVLQQSGVAILAQANTLPQAVLKLV